MGKISFVKPFLVSLCLAIPLIAVSQSDPYKNVYSESAWKERDSWQRSAELLERLKVNSSSVVADIGCNEGYFSFKLSAVTRKVYAVDVDQSKLDKLERIRTERKVTNITIVKGDYDNPKLPQNALDAVIILDTYHEMDDHDEILKHIMTALRPGGRLVLCEPIAEARRKLPRSDQERKHELGMNFAIDDLTKAGFKILEKTDPFIDREKQKSDKMWLIVAVKP